MTRLSLILLALSVPASPLRAEEKPAAPAAPVAPAFDGNFLGMDILAAHLGIVLDVSDSMKPVLPTIQEALRRQMPKTPVLHVDGCKLERPDPRPRIVRGVAPETATAISALGEHAGATAVLWITDLGDPPNKAGLEALDEMLEEREIRLFLLSLKNKPTPSLRKISIESEGVWELVSLPR